MDEILDQNKLITPVNLRMKRPRQSNKSDYSPIYSVPFLKCEMDRDCSPLQRRSNIYMEEAEEVEEDEELLLTMENENKAPVQIPHSTDEEFNEIDGSSGKLTLWQFLLELLLSNKYDNIIKWTNKQGEFILLQAETVAKLWGMRKDKNHRMNYDKLSRALRYYYQKNIIRKVHGRKFVYQFIGLKNLVKFCQSYASNTFSPLSSNQRNNEDRVAMNTHEYTEQGECVTADTEFRRDSMKLSAEREKVELVLEPNSYATKNQISHNVIDTSQNESYTVLKMIKNCVNSNTNSTTTTTTGNANEINDDIGTKKDIISNNVDCSAETNDYSIDGNISNILLNLASILSYKHLITPENTNLFTNQSECTNNVDLRLNRQEFDASKWKDNLQDDLNLKILNDFSNNKSFVMKQSEEIGFNNAFNNNNSNNSNNSKNNIDQLRDQSYYDVWKSGHYVEPFSDPCGSVNNLFYSGNPDEQRLPSPNCKCSCHNFSHSSASQFASGKVKADSVWNNPLQNDFNTNLSLFTPKSESNTTLDLESDNTSMRLHYERHAINMQRLNEQLFRINKLNRATNGVHTNHDTELKNDTAELHNFKQIENDHQCDLAQDDCGLEQNLAKKCVWMPVPITMLTSWFDLLNTLSRISSDSSRSKI